MSVTNGQIANQTTFNNAFVSKTAVSGNDATGIIGLNNTTDPNSGNQIFNTQRYQNEIADADGVASEGDANRKVYSSNNVVANGDNRKVAIGKLDAEFDISTGHDHNGVNSKQVSAADLADLNYYRAAWQTFTVLGADGTDDDISTQLTGKTPGGGTSAAGVITSAPYNKVEIRKSDDGTYIEDAGGQRVYGRITEAASVWTLTYYTNEAGVETAHTLATEDIRVYFLEVFTLDTVPTIPDEAGFIGSLDLTADIVDASATQRGVVSTGSQTLGGEKTFQDDLRFAKNLYYGSPTANPAAVGNIGILDGTSTLGAGSTYNLIGGFSHTVNGDQSIIWGSNNSHAVGTSNNILVGNALTSTSNFVALFGENNTVSGEKSIVSGNLNDISGNRGAAFGESCEVTGNKAMAQGEGCVSDGDNQSSFGQFNNHVGTPGAPAASDEIHSVGYGTSDGSRATAFAVRREGTAFFNIALDFAEQGSTPATPPTGFGRLYYDNTTQAFRYVDDLGNDSSIGSGDTYRSGTASIASGVATKAVTFSSALPSTNYSITCTLMNTTDASPQFQPITITAKSTTGFTASWNTNTDSANYNLEYSAQMHN